MTHTIDATAQSAGRLATEVARLLMGKHKASFTPNIDGGDIVQIVNASKISFSSAKKLEQKKYYRHSTYAHGLKTTSMQELFVKNPGEIIERAVSRMLPKNTFRARRMQRLSIQN